VFHILEQDEGEIEKSSAPEPKSTFRVFFSDSVKRRGIEFNTRGMGP
jgi:hypothetical protein